MNKWTKIQAQSNIAQAKDQGGNTSAEDQHNSKKGDKIIEKGKDGACKVKTCAKTKLAQGFRDKRESLRYFQIIEVVILLFTFSILFFTLLTARRIHLLFVWGDRC